MSNSCLCQLGRRIYSVCWGGVYIQSFFMDQLKIKCLHMYMSNCCDLKYAYQYNPWVFFELSQDSRSGLKLQSCKGTTFQKVYPFLWPSLYMYCVWFILNLSVSFLQSEYTVGLVSVVPTVFHSHRQYQQCSDLWFVKNSTRG